MRCYFIPVGVLWKAGDSFAMVPEARKKYLSVREKGELHSKMAVGAIGGIGEVLLASL